MKTNAKTKTKATTKRDAIARRWLAKCEAYGAAWPRWPEFEIPALADATDALVPLFRGERQEQAEDLRDDLRDGHDAVHAAHDYDSFRRSEVDRLVRKIARAVKRLVARPRAKAGDLTPAEWLVLRAAPRSTAKAPTTRANMVAKLAKAGTQVNKSTVTRAVTKFREMSPPLMVDDGRNVQLTREGDVKADAKADE